MLSHPPSPSPPSMEEPVPRVCSSEGWRSHGDPVLGFLRARALGVIRGQGNGGDWEDRANALTEQIT